MFKRKNILSILLATIVVLSNTMVLAQELVPDIKTDLMGGGVSIPDRKASSWALDELVDSDRYGLYKTEDFYKNNLKELLNDELREELLKNFKEKLENTKLEKLEKPHNLVEIKNPKTRGGFLRELYNTLVVYENEENLGKDPIMYLNHIGVLKGHGKELFLDRNITVEEGILFTKRAVDHIYSENNLDSKGLMWKVENKGNTIYLLGSIHYGEPELYPFRKDILNNFGDSETLYVEVDISNQEDLMKVTMEKMGELEAKMKKESKYEDGTTLKSQIDEMLYAKVETIMNKNNIIKEEYENFKIPGMEQKLNEIIVEKAISEISVEDQKELEEEIQVNMEKSMDNELMKLFIKGPELGVDLYFLDKAKTSNKKIGELESMESQMELLFGEGGLFGDLKDEKSKEEQIKSLKKTLESFDNQGNIIEIEEPKMDDSKMEEINRELEKEMEKQVNLIKSMFDAIREGNAEKLSKLFVESDGAEMLQGQLLGERDKNMAKKIGKLLEGEDNKTYFVVVGAAHFVVDGTIIDNLTNMGYKVERIR